MPRDLRDQKLVKTLTTACPLASARSLKMAIKSRKMKKKKSSRNFSSWGGPFAPPEYLRLSRKFWGGAQKEAQVRRELGWTLWGGPKKQLRLDAS